MNLGGKRTKNVVKSNNVGAPPAGVAQRRASRSTRFRNRLLSLVQVERTIPVALGTLEWKKVTVRTDRGRRPVKDFRLPGAFPLTGENFLLNGAGIDLPRLVPPGSRVCGGGDFPVFNPVGFFIILREEHNRRVPTEACEPKELANNILGTGTFD
jgi:hypothetical protein